jgi:hypothetical protein
LEGRAADGKSFMVENDVTSAASDNRYRSEFGSSSNVAIVTMGSDMETNLPRLRETLA